SATHSFTQIKQAADKCGARLVLANVSSVLSNAFRAIGFLSKDIIVVSDLDHALEWCENSIIAAHRRDDSAIRSLREWLSEALGSAEYADTLAQRCKRIGQAKPSRAKVNSPIPCISSWKAESPSS